MIRWPVARGHCAARPPAFAIFVPRGCQLEVDGESFGHPMSLINVETVGYSVPRAIHQLCSSPASSQKFRAFHDASRRSISNDLSCLTAMKVRCQLVLSAPLRADTKRADIRRNGASSDRRRG